MEFLFTARVYETRLHYLLYGPFTVPGRDTNGWRTLPFANGVLNLTVSPCTECTFTFSKGPRPSSFESARMHAYERSYVISPRLYFVPSSVVRLAWVSLGYLTNSHWPASMNWWCLIIKSDKSNVASSIHTCVHVARIVAINGCDQCIGRTWW